jgi:putative SOS response-associated peptidase YedK
MNKRGWHWPIRDKLPGSGASFNKCPSQRFIILAVREGKLGFHEMRWGLVPSWAKTVKDADKYSMINAKAEEIAEKRSYKAAFQKRRCIVPVSGFFEWKRSESKKRPYAIHLKDEPIMSLAGIWEHWVSPLDGDVVDSFAIVTVEANSFMNKIHNRMPVILDQQDEESWLNPEASDREVLSKIMKPCASSILGAFEISTMVNSPRNNSSEILNPV